MEGIFLIQAIVETHIFFQKVFSGYILNVALCFYLLYPKKSLLSTEGCIYITASVK